MSVAVDWKRIRAAKPNNLVDNPDEAHEVFTTLAKIGLDDVETAEMADMTHLFFVAKAIMTVKDQEYNVAVDELEKLESMKGRRESESIDGGVWKRRYEELDRESRLKELSFGRMKRENERLTEDVSSSHHRISDLEAKIRKLEHDVNDYQSQLQNQRESLLHQRDSGDATLRSREVKLDKYRNLVEDLEKMNGDLQEKNERLQTDLKSAVGEMNEATDKLEHLQSALREADRVNSELERTKQVLEAKVEDLSAQVKSQTTSDDQILGIVEEKAQEWQNVLAEKEEELAQCYDRLREQEDQISAAMLDQDKNSVMQLKQALERKSKEVESLKEKLEEASEEIVKATAELEEEREVTAADRRIADLQSRIRSLQFELKEERSIVEQEQKSRKQAEAESALKDQEISDLAMRMRQYEENHYGLEDAVQEIKEWKNKVVIRDRDISELTGQVNELESQLNDLHDENDALRLQLGLDPNQSVDLSTYRYRRNVELEQQKAVNRTLKKDIDRLEDERLRLRSQLVKQAMHRGERAIELGLKTEDLIAVEELAGEEPEDRKVKLTEIISRKGELERQVAELRDRVGSQERTIEVQKTEAAKVQLQLKECEEKNEKLFAGFREMQDVLKRGGGGGDGTVDGDGEIRCPALDTLLGLWRKDDKTTTVIQWSAQVEQLSGRNAELRSQLAQCRQDLTHANQQLERKSVELEKLRQEVDIFRETGGDAAALRPLPLPARLPVTYTELVGTLNEQLVTALEALARKEETASMMEKELENLKRKFSVVIHQQGVVYKEYLERRGQMESDVERLRAENEEVENRRRQDEIKLQELQKLSDSLRLDPDERQGKLVDATRKLTVMRLNEKELSRRLTTAQESNETLTKESRKLRVEMVEMEASIVRRLGFLQRYRETAQFQVNVLQTKLNESVPRDDLEAANRRYNDLTAKYRDLLQRETHWADRNREIENLKLELEQLREECRQWKDEVVVAKERAHIAERTLNEATGTTTTTTSANGGTAESGQQSYAQQLALLEMKELNERQKADHALRQQDLLKRHVSELEARNAELEEKFSELSRINIECQSTDRRLREELSRAVVRDEHERVVAQLRRLEETKLRLELEVSELKEIADVATHQHRALETLQLSQEKELASMRNQLKDFQCQSDERALMGKLHRHIVQLQVSESTAVRKLEAAHNRVLKLEAVILRLDHQATEKDQELYRHKAESYRRIERLRSTVQDLRRQFSGALPLEAQEKFNATFRDLQAKSLAAESELAKARDERRKAEDKVAGLETKQGDLEELLDTLRRGQGARKVHEWHQRMSEMRLEGLQLKTDLARQQENVRHLEDLMAKRNATIASLETTIASTTKFHEEQQLDWEKREIELESLIDRLRDQQEELANAAAQLEKANDSLPDPTLPVANQLEHAVRKLKEHAQMIVKTKTESKRMRERISALESGLKEKEDVLLSKEKIINELRLRLTGRPDLRPRTDDQQGEEAEAKKALSIAQATLTDMQRLIDQKEETVLKYQNLLEQLRTDMKKQNLSHEMTIADLQRQLRQKTADRFGKLKQAATDAVNVPQPPLPTDKQLSRLSELEDLVGEQDNAAASLRGKLLAAERQMMDVRRDSEKLATTFREEMDELRRAWTDDTDTLKGEVADLEEQLREREDEIKVLQTDLSAAVEAAKQAPSKTMRSLVERLRNQLSLKEQQNKSLSQALLQLRADLVATAQHNVESKAKEAAETVNVQELLDVQTGELQEKISCLQDKLTKLRIEAKNHRENEDVLRRRVTALEEELKRKESTVARQASEIGKLQKNVGLCSAKEMNLLQELDTLKRQGHASSEVDDLRRQVRRLKERLDRRQDPAQVAKHTAPLPSKPSKEERVVEVARWEENKKWQKRVETLKSRVASKTKELEAAQKQIGSLRETIGRLERERVLVQSRAKATASASRITGQDLVAETSSSRDEKAELRREVFELKQKNESLRQELEAGPSGDLQRVELTNARLIETIRSLEDQLRNLVGESEAETFDVLRRRERELRETLLSTEKDNLHLQLEVDTLNATVSRLQSRTDELEEYVDVLKSAADSANSRRQVAGGGGGKSVAELERVVSAMRRVVEKLQGENDALKRERGRRGRVAPGGDDNDDDDAEKRRLREEIERLKGELVDVKKKQPIEKLVAENERLRRDLRKEVEKTEKLNVKRGKLEVELRKRTEELDEKADLTTRPAGSLKVARVYEDKIEALEAELERKNIMLQEVKKHVKSAIDKEKEKGISDEAQALRLQRDQLLRENSQLRDELKAFDPGFFEEIEDLKYNYRVALEKNDRFRDQLELISRQFGITVDLLEE